MVIKHKFFAQKIIIKLRTRAREFSLLRKTRRKATGRVAMVKREGVVEIVMKSNIYKLNGFFFQSLFLIIFLQF